MFCFLAKEKTEHLGIIRQDGTALIHLIFSEFFQVHPFTWKKYNFKLINLIKQVRPKVLLRPIDFLGNYVPSLFLWDYPVRSKWHSLTILPVINLKPLCRDILVAIICVSDVGTHQLIDGFYVCASKKQWNIRVFQYKCFGCWWCIKMTRTNYNKIILFDVSIHASL